MFFAPKRADVLYGQAPKAYFTGYIL